MSKSRNKGKEICSARTSAWPASGQESLFWDVDDGRSVVFTQTGLTGGEEIPIEQLLGNTWTQLYDKDGNEVKLTASIYSVRVVAPSRVRPNKPVTTAAVALYYSR